MSSNKWTYTTVHNRRVYYIYKATSPSGKVYIGYTSRKLKYRIKNHIRSSIDPKTPFHRALKKYKNHVKFEIINVYFNEKLAKKMEPVFIRKYNSLTTQNGYNVSTEVYGKGRTYYSKDYREGKSELLKLYWNDNREILINKLKIVNKTNTVSKKALDKAAKVNSKKIIDNHGIIYKSLAQAAMDNNISESFLRSCIKNGYKSKNNKRFAYYNKGNFVFKLPAVRTKIKCIDNQKIYFTASEAAKDLGLPNAPSINRVCRGERSSYKGYRFIYVSKS